MLPMKVWDEEEKECGLFKVYILRTNGSEQMMVQFMEKKVLVRNFKLLYPTAQTDKMVNLFIKEILLKLIIILTNKRY